jgi:hypothetical protein
MAYPVTNGLRLKLKRALDRQADPALAPNTNPEYSRNRIVDAALEYIGEYEHGSVDVLDLFDDRNWTPENNDQGLNVISKVLEDFVGSLFIGLGGTTERDWTN